MEEAIKEFYFNDPRAEMLKYIPTSTKKVLDIGCANGMFSSLIKEKLGAEAWGVELNEEAAESASQKLDKVLVGDVYEALDKLPENFFDCIIFNDVLEHLVDPYTLIRRIKRNISKNGVVVASIPNIRHAPILLKLVLGGDWKYQEWGVLDKTHLRFFTRKSIERMFIEQGYSLLKVDGINRSQSFRGRAISKVLIGPLKDFKYIQFACLATPIS